MTRGLGREGPGTIEMRREGGKGRKGGHNGEDIFCQIRFSTGSHNCTSGTCGQGPIVPTYYNLTPHHVEEHNANLIIAECGH